METLRAIVAREARGSSFVWAGFPNPKARSGLGVFDPLEDHSDHIYSGLAMLQAVNYYPCIEKRLYDGYQTAHRPENLAPLETAIQGGAFGATVSGLLAGNDAWNTFEPFHFRYLGRRYVDTLPGSGAPCSF